MRLSVLIPAFNEQFTIENVVERVLSVQLPDDMTVEVIAVDDCSTDGTAERLDKVVAEHDNVTLYRHHHNKGKGAAIRTALGHSTGDIVVIQDADLEYDPEDYAKLLAPILSGDADAVFGSRFLPSSQRRVLYFWHSVGNRFLTILSNMFTDLNLTDMETCYKMVRGDILRSIPIRSDRFGIEPELTAKLKKRGCRIYEVPISYRGRTYEEGKKITWRDGAAALWVILRFWLVDDLYTEKFGHHILHRMSKAHRFNAWMADSIKPFVGNSVLEIGSGVGNLTQKLLPRERYVASDIDPMYLEYLGHTYGESGRVDIAKVDLEDRDDFESEAGSFDTVVCLNVLEHVTEDVRALENIHLALQPGGRACVLVPRSQRLYGTLDETLDHKRRYDEPELREKLERAGFDVETVFDFNKTTVPGWWWNGRVMRRRQVGLAQLKIFDSMVWLLRRVEWMLPWMGVSLIAVARKPEQP